MKYRFLFLVNIIFFKGFSQKVTKDSVKEVLLDSVVLLNEKSHHLQGITKSSLIGTRTLETFSPIEMTNSINQIPGVYALSGAINTNRITIRGIGSRTPYETDKLRLYYNGIPMTNGAGASSIEALDVENLEAINVVKGPKGTFYGANLGGAILLESKALKENETNLVNTFTMGSYAMLKDNVFFTHGEENFSLGISYNHTEVDGYRENNSYFRDGVLIKSKYKLKQNQEIGLLVNYIDYYAQIASSISQTTFDEDPTQAAGNWLAAKGYEDNVYTLVGVYYKGNITKLIKNRTSVFYNYLDAYEARPFNILDQNTNGYGFKTQFEGNFTINDRKASVFVGAELYKDKYVWSTFRNLYRDNNGNGSLEGNQLSDNIEFRNQLNISSSFVLPLTNKFTAQFNLALNKTTYDFTDNFNSGADNKSAKRSFNPILLPSLSLEYETNSNHSVYFNVSKGFSNPNLEETLTPDGVINPEIRQEVGFNYEVGSKVQLFEKSLKIDASIYQMDVSGLLVAERIGEDQYIGRNAGRTKHRGIELDMNYSTSFFFGSSLEPYFRYTLNDHSFVDFVDGDENFSGNRLTGVPMHKVDAGMYWRLNDFYVNTTYQFVDEIPLTDANTLSSDGFSLMNARVGYQSSIMKNLTVGLNLGVNNIFNKKYAQSVLINAVGFGGSEPRYFYPGNNRNYYGSLRISYSI